MQAQRTVCFGEVNFDFLHNIFGYCKSGNFGVTLIFALFAHFRASAKLKMRESVYFVCRSM